MGKIEDRLQALGIVLPEPLKPLGAYVPCVRVSNLIFLSGLLPLKGGLLTHKGKAGTDVSVPDAKDAARMCAINALSVLRQHAGGLDNVERCVKITGYIASSEGFTDQPAVLNGASEFMIDVFGDMGRHARSAVGVQSLPLDSPVEIEFIFQLREGQ